MNKYMMYSIFLFAIGTSYLTAVKEDVTIDTLTELINKGVCIGFTVQMWNDIDCCVKKLHNAVIMGKIKDKTKCHIIIQGVDEICSAYKACSNKDKMFSHLICSIDTFERLIPKKEVKKKLLPEDKFKRMYIKTF